MTEWSVFIFVIFIVVAVFFIFFYAHIHFTFVSVKVMNEAENAVMNYNFNEIFAFRDIVFDFLWKYS